MSDCSDKDCAMVTLKGSYCVSMCQKFKAQNPASTTAGLDGSSVLMVAPRGEQQLDPSGSQLGPMVAPDSKSDKGGAHCPYCGIWNPCSSELAAHLIEKH